MAELVWTEELRGLGAPVEGSETHFKVETAGKNSLGDDVKFVSDVRMTADGFTESGRITYPGRGSLEFDVIGSGHMGPSPIEGLNHGTVMWNVVSGDGEFVGATGLITSNFTFSEKGEVVDNHCLRLFTP